MTVDLKKMWTSICQKVRTNPRYEILSPWMDKIRIVELNNDSLFVDLDDKNLKPFITSQHINLLNEIANPEDSISENARKNISVRFIESQKTTPQNIYSTENTLKKYYISRKQLNTKYSFDSFLVGPSNRLAYAAAKSICEKDVSVYNPLFIHGDTGFGKTHLIHSICNETLKNNPENKILYIPCESFMHDVESFETRKNISDFRNNFYDTDILIIENIHFIVESSSASFEFFHIFNFLYDLDKQIIISSNKPPHAIEGLPENISSRLKWGLVVELENTTREIRSAIIREKLKYYKSELSQDIQDYMADNITEGIRELEGALLKLTSYSSLLKQPLTTEIATRILNEYIPAVSDKKYSIIDIQRQTCEYFNISIDEMLSKKRARSLVMPRHIAMFLVRNITSASLEEIGEAFGNRDHSTVKHAYEKIKSSVNTDSNINSAVENIKQALLNSC